MLLVITAELLLLLLLSRRDCERWKTPAAEEARATLLLLPLGLESLLLLKDEEVLLWPPRSLSVRRTVVLRAVYVHPVGVVVVVHPQKVVGAHKCGLLSCSRTAASFPSEAMSEEKMKNALSVENVHFHA